MQIIYFPYLNLKNQDELDFGDFKIWNFDRKANEYIPDETLRSYIGKLMASNVTRKQPIKDIGVLSIGAVDFRVFNEEEFQLAKEARLLMFVSYISKVNISATGVNGGHYMATSENFTYVTQNFQPESDHIAEQSGFIVRKLMGGYRVDEVTFNSPSFLLTPMRFALDGELIGHLLLLRKKQKRLYRRILRAIDLLFESYFNDPYLSLNARVLLQVGAFEVLLDLPEEGQRRVFKDLIHQHTDNTRETQVKFYSERRGSKVKEKASRKVKWADKFYTLRNHIIHGNAVPIDDFYFERKQRHIDVSLLFFILIIKRLINEKLPRPYYFDTIDWKKTDYAVDNQYGFEFVDHSIMRRLSRIR
ncbi:hypothetical protein HGA88_05405 [Candidatus Roizmanbacteria bacterium]|nr:hypothetical protein [Candidatus Roizmanbacteria bacterium]